jgi:zinc protease
LEYPEFIDVTLNNGLRILIAEHHEQPAVFYRILVRAGLRDEPEGHEGVAELTAALVNQGTNTRSAGEIMEKIDAIGGYIRTSVNQEYTVIGCDVLAEDFIEGLNLFSDIVMKAIFPKKEFKRHKKQVITDVRRSEFDPILRARGHALNMFFGTVNRLGKEKSIKTLRRTKVSDVRAFYRDYYVPNNSILLAIGDLSKKEMLGFVLDLFDTWRNEKLNPRKAIFSTSPDHARIRLVHYPDLTQGTIVILQPGVPSRDPELPAFRVMNYIFGGGKFSSRLMTVIRAEEGRTYSISSWEESYPDFGTFWISTSTRNDEVINTYKLIQKELKKLIQNGVTEEELRRAKSYYSGNMPLQLESPQSIALHVLGGLYNGSTLEELRRQPARINEVTLEDVHRVAKNYLDANAFVLVFVGNRKALGKNLDEIGEIEYID